MCVVRWGWWCGGGSVGRGVGRGVGPGDVGRDAVKSEHEHDPLHWWKAQGRVQAFTSVRALTARCKRQGADGPLQAVANGRALTAPCDRPGANGALHEACDP